MTDQPEALRLAELLDGTHVVSASTNTRCEQAAAELRRLHALNAELLEALKDPRSRYGWANQASEYYVAIAKAEAQQ